MLVLALACVAVPAAGQVLSPGPLARAHAKLEGDQNCGKCHSSGRQVSAQLCLGCHTDLAKRIGERTGLHGRAYRGQACESCHVEHIGVNARLVRWPGGDMKRLDHALTGWPLEGAHKSLDCARCHRQATASGTGSFLGVSTACASCHSDAHNGRFGQACADCHNQSSFTQVSMQKFDHSLARFALLGAHQKVACQGCHGQPARWTGLAFGACTDCHTDPHGGRFPKTCQSCHDEKSWKGADVKMRGKHPWLSLAAGHARVACGTCHDRGSDRPPSRGKECVGCHRPVHEAKLGNRCEGCHESIRWLGLPREIGLKAHASTPFALEGAHAEVGCDRCHLPTLSVDRRFRKLTFDRCGACHKDPHGGEFAARDRGECGACHTPAGFSPSTFGVAAHATTAFVLDGRHQAAPCSGCHTSVHPRVSFHATQRACADCHANPHGDEFAKEMTAGGCAHCHTTADWGRPKVDHSTWPLTGAHEATPCASCHRSATAGAARAAYRGIPRACDGCHEDVHAGQFRLAEPVRGCADCHATQSFTVAMFDHAARTGWPLEAKHAQLRCDACHTSEKLRNGTDAVRWRLGYRRCQDCHANPHGGKP